MSAEDALRDAEAKLQKTQQKIDGSALDDKDYEVDIVEEVIHTLDEDNVATRNRYGALVLNSKKLMFIDIDTYSKTVFDVLFNRSLSQKELMLKRIHQLVKKRNYHSFGFRVYETTKGFRVMVLNQDFSARSRISKRLMSDFNADYLYRWLCIKQNCYRARLTPKPYRIKQKGTKVIYPDRTEEQQKALSEWIDSYESKSTRFSTCRLALVWGPQEQSRVIDYHDEKTGIRQGQKLA